jgi:hypothetical protein
MVSNSEAFHDERDFLHPPWEWIGLIIRVHENAMSVNIFTLAQLKSSARADGTSGRFDQSE